MRACEEVMEKLRNRSQFEKLLANWSLKNQLCMGKLAKICVKTAFWGTRKNLNKLAGKSPVGFTFSCTTTRFHVT